MVPEPEGAAEARVGVGECLFWGGGGGFGRFRDLAGNEWTDDGAGCKFFEVMCN